MPSTRTYAYDTYAYNILARIRLSDLFVLHISWTAYNTYAYNILARIRSSDSFVLHISWTAYNTYAYNILAPSYSPINI